MQKTGGSLSFGHLEYFDATKLAHKKNFEKSFLSGLVNGDMVTVQEALDDLKQKYKSEPSKFVKKLNSTFKKLPKRSSLLNHDFRNNSDIVKRRFRLYQVLQAIGKPPVTQAIFTILKGNEDTLADAIWDVCRKYKYLQVGGKLSSFTSKRGFVEYLQAHPTKKRTQRSLAANSPAPATLSIPDDACYYDEYELRVLTVREMARIQSFPDYFVFRSKATTGGQMRKFEVPQYTQVGNAVPPLLGLKLGQCISEILKYESP